MATEKKKEMSGLINPANLWGKPLPRSLSRPPVDGGEETVDYEDDDEPVAPTRRKNVRAEMDDDFTGPTDDDLRAEDENDDDVEDEDADESSEDEDETDDPRAETDDDADADDENDDDGETDELDEDEESESEEVGAAVASDDDDVTERVTRTKKGTAMAETKKKSISDHVREEIERRQKSGDSLRGVDIVTALAARKIKVSAAQVSQLLKKAGVSAKARGKRKLKDAPVLSDERSRTAHKAKPRKAAEETATPRSAPARGPMLSDTSFSFQLPMTQLQAAEKFVAVCGGLKKAEQILTLAAQLASRTANN